MADMIEHELCANCKKEIPQTNYVMHTVHCARNITLCPQCKEPFPKSQFEAHKANCPGAASRGVIKKQQQQPAPVDKGAVFGGTSMKNGHTSNSNSSKPTSKPLPTKSAPSPPQPKQPKPIYQPTSDYAAPKQDAMLACKYCDLELPKLDLEEHENYCGTRTDKCNECGEFVMFKYKKLHEDSNHGFVKLSDEPGPKPSWDSTTQRSASTTNATESYQRRRSRLPPLDTSFTTSSLYNMMDYIPPSTSGRFAGETAIKIEKGESYKEMSRRLDCKTEYIRNLLHDSASIVAPLRSLPTAPRNHFNHNKGPAPQPPHRRRNPPTELTIPCEFCDTPIPHQDLIQHETGCRPDLARLNLSPRIVRRRSPSPEETFSQEQGAGFRGRMYDEDEDLPCEYCSHMFPASQLMRHQLNCTN